MFENFTFGAQLRPDEQIVHVSPYDTSLPSPVSHSSFPSPPPSSPIDHLMSQLDEQTLDIECDDLLSSHWSLPSPPPESSFDYHDAPSRRSNTRPYVYRASAKVVQPLPPVSPSSRAIKCRRLQRQISSQLLCTLAQQKSIDSLVEGMLAAGNQCTISSKQTPSKPTTVAAPLTEEAPALLLVDDAEDDDEGFFEADPLGDESLDTVTGMFLSLERGPQTLTGGRRCSGPYGIRRAGDWGAEGGGVLCPPRVRKSIGKRRVSERTRRVTQ